MFAIAAAAMTALQRVLDTTSLFLLKTFSERILSSFRDDHRIANLLKQLEGKDLDAIVVWDEVDPTLNVYRFMVYILWLWNQPRAYGKFALLRQERPESWKKCLASLKLYRKGYESEEETYPPGTL